jgi:pSer/pThr/pTyr-binding forkhead associated (FHA) protein
MRVQLTPLDGGTPIEITKDLVLVGRKEDCDIRLDHKSISKIHCAIVKTDGLLLLRDLGSTNGTRVNGQRVRRAALLPNDQLHIASLRFKVQFVANDKEAKSVASPNEYTQQIEGKELARLLEKTEKPGDLDSDSDIDMPVVQTNALPDVYPENTASGK